MPTVRVHHADGLWLADVARPQRRRDSRRAEEPTSALRHVRDRPRPPTATVNCVLTRVPVYHGVHTVLYGCLTKPLHGTSLTHLDVPGVRKGPQKRILRMILRLGSSSETFCHTHFCNGFTSGGCIPAHVALHSVG